MSSKPKVWTCKIVVDGDAELPVGADSPPRQAAMQAVRAMGVDVVACFSGWGGTLTVSEEKVVNTSRTTKLNKPNA